MRTLFGRKKMNSDLISHLTERSVYARWQNDKNGRRFLF